MSGRTELRNFIDGEFAAAAGGRMEITDPSTGEVYATAPRSDARDVDRPARRRSARSPDGGGRRPVSG